MFHIVLEGHGRVPRPLGAALCELKMHWQPAERMWGGVPDLMITPWKQIHNMHNHMSPSRIRGSSSDGLRTRAGKAWEASAALRSRASQAPPRSDDRGNSSVRAGEQRIQAEDALHARTGPPRSRNSRIETDRRPRRDGTMACRTASARYDPNVPQWPDRRFLHINNGRGNSG